MEQQQNDLDIQNKEFRLTDLSSLQLLEQFRHSSESFNLSSYVDDLPSAKTLYTLMNNNDDFLMILVTLCKINSVEEWNGIRGRFKHLLSTKELAYLDSSGLLVRVLEMNKFSKTKNETK